MRRSALWLGAAASAAVVAYLFFPILRCPETCFVDPIGVAGPGLGHIELPDLYLNAWILGWVQRALLTAPSGLFDANVFYPAPAVLTQSEHMLGIALWTLPLRLFSTEAVWLHQVALAGSSLLLALTTGALVRWLTGSVWAGFAAGATAVFMPWRFTELSHVQLMNVQWFPLVWLWMGRVVEQPERPRHAVLLSAALFLQLLASFYLAYFLLLSCAALLIGWWIFARPSRLAWKRLAQAAALPLLALVAIALPYLHWSRVQGFQAADALFDSVPPADVLSLTLPALPTALRSLPVETSYAVPLGVALLGLVAWIGLRRAQDGAPSRERAFVVGLTLACVGAGILALGRRLAVGDASLPLPGSLAAAIVPGFENLRNPLRFAIVIGVAAPVLAGVGFARVEALARSGPARGGLRFVLLALLAANVVTPPLPALDAWAGQTDRRAVYRALAALPEGPLLEIPWPLQIEHDAIHAARAMLGSTLHWHPLLNGHSGYVPRSYPFLRQVGQALPSPEGIARLEALVDVRYVLVHLGELAPDRRRAWRHVPAGGPLRRVFTQGDQVLYEVKGWREAGRYREAVASAERRDTSLAGLPRTPLPAAEQKGALQLDIEGAFHYAGRRRLPKPVTLRLRNDTERTWPGFDPDPDGMLRLRARFVDAAGIEAASDSYALVADVPPGTSTLVVPIAPPARAGRYRLLADLVQRIDDADHALAVPAFELPVEVKAHL